MPAGERNDSQSSPMLTIETLNAAAKRSSARQVRWTALGLVQVLGVALGLAWEKDSRADLLLSPVAAPFVVAGILFASFLVFLYCMLKAARVDRTFPELLCPHCRTSLG